MIEKPLSDHARIKELESALTALREERAQLKHENERLLTRRASEGDSPRQPAAPTDDDYPTIACPNCGDEATDLDGFGFMACTVCGYCTHPSRTGGVCGICGDAEPESADARILKPDGSQASGSATDRDLRTAIAHLTEERKGLQDQLMTANSELLAVRSERDGAEEAYEESATFLSQANDELAALTEVHERLRTLLTDVASSGFEDIDPRIDYVEVQIDRELWTELRSALLSPREGTQLLEDQELTNDLTRRDTSGNSTDDPPQPPTGR